MSVRDDVADYVLGTALPRIDGTGNYGHVVNANAVRSGPVDLVSGVLFPRVGAYIAGGQYTFEGVPIGKCRDTIRFVVEVFNNCRLEPDADSRLLHQDVERAMLTDSRMGGLVDRILPVSYAYLYADADGTALNGVSVVFDVVATYSYGNP